MVSGVVAAPRSSGGSDVDGSGNPRRVKNEDDRSDESCLPVTPCLPSGPPAASPPMPALRFFLLAGEQRRPNPGEAPNPSCARPRPSRSLPARDGQGKGVTRHLPFFDLKSVGNRQILIQIM
ncbi:hypothetical protein VPH35_059760 [Triticum aestivum]